ncbi:MAG: ammonia-forming cytochrome c nitrite reductase subunit c552 [Candidatus Azobacteroides sp.]|nr:ammonia-forming cytochrome c nitrite reductase subunit c552 [Candidatus Azobacteroides sp.]
MSRAHSFLSEEPAACVNCHIMTPYYQSWNHSSHAQWETCNDCHVLQENLLTKYTLKTKDGIYHTIVLTIRGEAGSVKYSNRLITSPLKNINNTCQTCHRDSEENLRNYVYQYQDKALEIRDRVEKELSKAHIMAKTAWEKGATESQMTKTMKLLRQAQWRWDFAVASHGASFHAPVETQRILAHSLDKTMLAQLELQKVLFSYGITEVEFPDLSTKDNAQAYIGLDMQKLKENKEEWIKTVVPEWIEEAKKNGRLTANADI